ncbi:exodeoxyribonuclease III [Rickettsiales endosymbiont of Stachyamoeba lipophora]|uniref:exodeoxyribonuclease III n=1 Tax=Rickettsiales endosymbiont of Stachyamoeba lipophora TaxID=2486578 RepID=UPI000F64B69E|nr:exodeoxyribonuclease III [Rickettsiales endosymbiont of Stachyamoeba lipophora]AZL16402.1 exodeoxyribonuclease III [Rickettsiales endosymbiont of Stachyamoeba lipophora]
MLKLSCWNVNSLPARIDLVKEFITQENPDVLIFQELKTITESFPYEFFSDLGYNSQVYGQKTYNGVAIISKHLVEETILGKEVFHEDEHARYIESLINFNGQILRIGNVYVPNGGEVGSDKFEYKLKFLDRLYEHLQQVCSWKEHFVIGGDFNIAPENIDVYDSSQLFNHTCFHVEEQKRLNKIFNLPLFDGYRLLHPNTQQFSWWDYRAGAFQRNQGMRIDHLLFSPQLIDYVEEIYFSKEFRSKPKPSDHIPLTALINFNRGK